MKLLGWSVDMGLLISLLAGIDRLLSLPDRLDILEVRVMTSLEQIISDIAAGLEEQKAGTASLLESVAAESQQVLEKIAEVQATVDGEAATQLDAIKETIQNNNAAILAAKSAVENIVVVPAVPETPPVEPPAEPVVEPGEE